MALCARDLMQTEVKTVDASMSLAMLEEVLLRNRVGGAPVVDGGHVVGIVSRSDIVRMATLDRSLAGVVSDFYQQITDFSGEPAAQQWKREQHVEEHLADRQVRDAMTPELITVSPATPIHEVARLLVERHIHRVLVTESKRLVGLISSSDLVRAIADGRLSEAAA